MNSRITERYSKHYSSRVDGFERPGIKRNNDVSFLALPPEKQQEKSKKWNVVCRRWQWKAFYKITEKTRHSLVYFLSLDKETEEANELLNRGKLSFKMVILQNTNAQIYSIQPISLRVRRVRSIGRIPK